MACSKRTPHCKLRNRHRYMKAGACTGFEKRMQSRFSSDAFTRIELAAVIGTFFALLLLVLPLLANNSLRSNQIGCLNNLRQIGIAFQAWGNDHDDLRPWFVPMEQGGTRLHPLRNNAFLHYTLFSNHISPTLLIDPAETARTKRMATNWTYSPAGGFLNASFANNALSYIVGCHTSLAETHDILSGDRNLQFGGISSCSYGFSQVFFLNASPSFRGWTNGPHGALGNLLFNDGRVEFTSSDRLRQVLISDSDGPNASSHFLSPF